MTSDQPPAAAPTRRARREPEPPPPSKAGRDLKAAITVGVILAAVALGSLLLLPEAFLALVLIVMGVGGAVPGAMTVGVRVPIVLVILGGSAMIVVAYYQGRGRSSRSPSSG